MPSKDDPDRLLFPGFTNRVMVDTWRGKVRVRKWPEKRGRPKSAAVRAQNDWFRTANRLASRAPPTQMCAAIAITKNSGLYPRDILMRMMAGNMGPIPRSDGRIITKASKETQPVSFQGTILNYHQNVLFTGNSFVPVVWSLPILDTAGMWSPAAPDDLVIPAGVSIVEVTAGFRFLGGVNTSVTLNLILNGVATVLARSGTFNPPGITLTSGPQVVTPGDTFKLQAVPALSATSDKGPECFLSIEILQQA